VKTVDLMLKKISTLWSWACHELTAWVSEPRGFWLTFWVVIALCSVAYLVPMDSEPRIRWLGMIFQLLGVVTVATGIRDVRKLFAKPSLTQELKDWLHRFPLPFRNVSVPITGVAAITEVGDSLEARAWTGQVPNANTEQRIATLERQVNALASLFGGLEEHSRAGFGALRELTEQERDNRQTADDALSRRLEESMVGGISLEITGVVWLSIGIVMSSASIELARWCVNSSAWLCTIWPTADAVTLGSSVQLPELRGDWLVAGATLVAALFGAGTGSWLAYCLESRRRGREVTRARIGSINRALFALYRYWNELLPYRREMARLVETDFRVS
jgi:hypothetical protein